MVVRSHNHIPKTDFIQRTEMNFSLQKFLTGTFLATVVVGTSTAWAAGSHGGGHGFSFGEPGQMSEVNRTIRVTASDTDFNFEQLHIHAGETIRFVVTNGGELDHDFTIGPAALQEQHRQEMMDMMSGEEGMAKMHNDPNAVFVKPGETKELIWTFTDVQDLEFACNVPGHYEAGMKGNITPNGDHMKNS